MPVAVAGGIATHYEVAGSGPPLLMFSPGGFSATAANWTSFSLYARLDLLDQLAKEYTCITFAAVSPVPPVAGWNGSPGGTTRPRAGACWSIWA